MVACKEVWLVKAEDDTWRMSWYLNSEVLSQDSGVEAKEESDRRQPSFAKARGQIVRRRPDRQKMTEWTNQNGLSCDLISLRHDCPRLKLELP